MQKKFCGGEGAILLRKIDAHSALIGVKPSIPDKVDDVTSLLFETMIFYESEDNHNRTRRCDCSFYQRVILMWYQNGFKIKDRLLRALKVFSNFISAVKLVVLLIPPIVGFFTTKMSLSMPWQCFSLLYHHQSFNFLMFKNDEMVLGVSIISVNFI